MYHLLGHPKRKRSYSNHPFSGAFAVSLREGTSIVSCFSTTLQGTNISPQNGILKMIFLFPKWDMFNVQQKKQRRFDVFFGNVRYLLQPERVTEALSGSEVGSGGTDGMGGTPLIPPVGSMYVW